MSSAQARYTLTPRKRVGNRAYKADGDWCARTPADGDCGRSRCVLSKGTIEIGEIDLIGTEPEQVRTCGVSVFDFRHGGSRLKPRYQIAIGRLEVDFDNAPQNADVMTACEASASRRRLALKTLDALRCKPKHSSCIQFNSAHVCFWPALEATCTTRLAQVPTLI